MTWGPVPVRAVERSSPKVTSRTQCSWFSICQWPRIHAASWADRAWAAGSLRLWVRADRAELDPVLYRAMVARLERDWPFDSVDYDPRA